MSLPVSVVIPAYNVESFILPAIYSALSQSVQDVEVIVVDDGSTDATALLAASVEDKRVRILRQENAGLSAARNAGIRAAQGKYIGFLDGDDIWFPSKAREHLGPMEADPGMGLTYSHSAYIDENGELTGQLLISTIHRPDLQDMLIRNLVGNGSTPIVRRDCLYRVGLFDESLHALEDWEMWVRILGKSGFRAGLIPLVLTGYRVRKSSMSMNIEKWTSDCEQAVDTFAAYLPGNWATIRATILAESHRITARKALSTGQYELAGKLLRKAWRQSPMLFCRDLRAMGTLVLFLLQSMLPAHFRQLPYDVALRCLKTFYRATTLKD
jgi:glycosyltransferase involved in cell wall biosynthesis